MFSRHCYYFRIPCPPADIQSNSPSQTQSLHNTKREPRASVSLNFPSLSIPSPGEPPIFNNMTMALKSIDRRIITMPALLVSLFCAITLMPTVFHVHQQIRYKTESLPTQSATNGDTLSPTSPTSSKLVFVTLSFKFPAERPMLDHNCARLSNAGYKYYIYTDDIHQPYCSVCKCIPFEPKNCTCPQPERYDCSLCEKLEFLVDLITTTKEFVFIDSDLIILRDDFMPALQARTLYFDFLASYGFGNYSKWRFKGSFNSGLMFVRRLEHIDYRRLITMMSEMGTNNDQNVISNFVHKFYKRWDTLSLRWHCRYLFRSEHNINFDDCFTFHGRRHALRSILKGRNFSLLQTQTI